MIVRNKEFMMLSIRLWFISLTTGDIFAKTKGLEIVVGRYFVFQIGFKEKTRIFLINKWYE